MVAFFGVNEGRDKTEIFRKTPKKGKRVYITTEHFMEKKRR